MLLFRPQHQRFADNEPLTEAKRAVLPPPIREFPFREGNVPRPLASQRLPPHSGDEGRLIRLNASFDTGPSDTRGYDRNPLHMRTSFAHSHEPDKVVHRAQCVSRSKRAFSTTSLSAGWIQCWPWATVVTSVPRLIACTSD